MKSNEILDDFILVEKNLNENSNTFCQNLQTWDATYFSRFQTKCNDGITLRSAGLRDNIRFILVEFNFFYLSFINEPFKNYDFMVSKMKNYNFTLDIEKTIFYIDAAIIQEMNVLLLSLNKYFDNNINISIARISIYIIALFIELILFIYIGKYLKNMLNKDKSILELIPNEVLYSSENVKEALTMLNGLT